MKAFILDRYGSADRVRAGDLPDPELREDDVLVQIHAAGVNLLDSKLDGRDDRAGILLMEPQLVRKMIFFGPSLAKWSRLSTPSG